MYVSLGANRSGGPRAGAAVGFGVRPKPSKKRQSGATGGGVPSNCARSAGEDGGAVPNGEGGPPATGPGMELTGGGAIDGVAGGGASAACAGIKVAAGGVAAIGGATVAGGAIPPGVIDA